MRIPNQRTAIEVGIEQVRRLCQELAYQRTSCFPIVLADAGYGCHGFLGVSRELPIGGILVRLRKNRVLHRESRLPSSRTGSDERTIRFAFDEPTTWGKLDQATFLADRRWASVKIEVWHCLYSCQARNVPLAAICIQVHQERDKPPDPLWLAWLGPYQRDPSVFLRWYEHRWPVEPAIRFRKRRLCWTLPRLHEPHWRDRWTGLVDLAQWMLFLGRGMVQTQPRPWQRGQAMITPRRVQQGWGEIRSQIGTPTVPPHTATHPWCL